MSGERVNEQLGSGVRGSSHVNSYRGRAKRAGGRQERESGRKERVQKRGLTFSRNSPFSLVISSSSVLIRYVSRLIHKTVMHMSGGRDELLCLSKLKSETLRPAYSWKKVDERNTQSSTRPLMTLGLKRCLGLRTAVSRVALVSLDTCLSCLS